jgi:hypothetical protein
MGVVFGDIGTSPPYAMRESALAVVGQGRSTAEGKMDDSLTKAKHYRDQAKNLRALAVQGENTQAREALMFSWSQVMAFS